VVRIGLGGDAISEHADAARAVRSLAHIAATEPPRVAVRKPLVRDDIARARLRAEKRRGER
jgi:hypothetical protein